MERKSWRHRIDINNMGVDDTSAFSPRVNPRPTYPPFFTVFRKFLWLYARDAILGCMLATLLSKPFYYLHEVLPVTDRQFFAIVLGLAHSGTFVIFNGGLHIMDQLGLLDDFKIGRKPAEVPSKDLFKSLYTEAFINHVITSPLVALGLYSVVRNLGIPSAETAMPTMPTLALTFLGAHAFNDIGFYFTHRLLHHPVSLLICVSSNYRTPLRT